eukprot:Amastigsp_a1333_33.p7 type:complete len:145 gc:universal Amastigsp_a1333_33:794-360(-)
MRTQSAMNATGKNSEKKNLVSKFASEHSDEKRFMSRLAKLSPPRVRRTGVGHERFALPRSPSVWRAMSTMMNEYGSLRERDESRASCAFSGTDAFVQSSMPRTTSESTMSSRMKNAKSPLAARGHLEHRCDESEKYPFVQVLHM